MSIALAIILVSLAAASSCVCVCADVEAEFETACRERGGQVQRGASSASCTVGKSVVATWTLDEEDGGP